MKNLVLLIIFMIVNQLAAEDNLVAFWSFEDGTAKDVSGNGYHGTLMNSPTSALGHDGEGKSIKLEGFGENTSQGDHILLP